MARLAGRFLGLSSLRETKTCRNSDKSLVILGLALNECTEIGLFGYLFPRFQVFITDSEAIQSCLLGYFSQNPEVFQSVTSITNVVLNIGIDVI